MNCKIKVSRTLFLFCCFRSPFSLASPLQTWTSLRFIKARKPLNHNKVRLLWQEKIHGFPVPPLPYQTTRVLPVDWTCLWGTPQGLATLARVWSLTNFSVSRGYHRVTSPTHCRQEVFTIFTIVCTIKIFTILCSILCTIIRNNLGLSIIQLYLQ